MTGPTPASLSEPMPSALAKAIAHAEGACNTTDLDLARTWAQVAQAQEAYRSRRELRAITDQLKRLRRALLEEVPNGE